MVLSYFGSKFYFCVALKAYESWDTFGQPECRVCVSCIQDLDLALWVYLRLGESKSAVVLVCFCKVLVDEP